MTDGFAYGNTRLRARKAGFLTAADYAVLVRSDVDGLLAALAETPYRPDVRAALPRFSGVRCLQEALRTHVARALTEMRSFYGGSERDQVDLLLGRWDLHNLRTVLRGLARLAPADEIGALLVPAGALDEAVLRELAAQPHLRAAVDLLVTWGIPRPDVARAVLAAWPAFERTGDPAVLEDALHRSWAARVGEEVADGPEPLARILRREIDLTNVLGALRRRRARERGEPAGAGGGETPAALPGGHLGASTIERVAAAAGRTEAVTALAAAPLPDAWQAALRAWDRHGDLPALTGDLETLLAREAIAGFVAGDPLGIAVPVAFTWATENEARNLRLVGESVRAGDPPDLALERLVVAP